MRSRTRKPATPRSQAERARASPSRRMTRMGSPPGNLTFGLADPGTEIGRIEGRIVLGAALPVVDRRAGPPEGEVGDAAEQAGGARFGKRLQRRLEVGQREVEVGEALARSLPR